MMGFVWVTSEFHCSWHPATQCWLNARAWTASTCMPVSARGHPMSACQSVQSGCSPAVPWPLPAFSSSWCSTSFLVPSPANPSPLPWYPSSTWLSRSWASLSELVAHLFRHLEWPRSQYWPQFLRPRSCTSCFCRFGLRSAAVAGLEPRSALCLPLHICTGSLSMISQAEIYSTLTEPLSSTVALRSDLTTLRSLNPCSDHRWRSISAANASLPCGSWGQSRTLDQLASLGPCDWSWVGQTLASISQSTASP